MKAESSIRNGTNPILVMNDGNRTIRRFTLIELRQQIHTCEIKTSVARSFGEDGEALFYDWFCGVMEEALQVLITESVKANRNRAGNNFNAESIKTDTDITEVTERYIKLKKTGRNLTGLCPFHKEKHPSFTVYPNTQSWYCFSCCKGGDVINFIMLIEGTDFRSALSILKGVIP